MLFKLLDQNIKIQRSILNSGTLKGQIIQPHQNNSERNEISGLNFI